MPIRRRPGNPGERAERGTRSPYGAPARPPRSAARRRGPDTLDIGYWVHPSFTRRGIATAAAHLLTNAAFSIDGIELVEIHHDKANRASAGVPRRLGFTFVGERPDQREAPSEVGIDCAWRVSRADWTRASSSSA